MIMRHIFPQHRYAKKSHRPCLISYDCFALFISELCFQIETAAGMAHCRSSEPPLFWLNAVKIAPNF